MKKEEFLDNQSLPLSSTGNGQNSVPGHSPGPWEVRENPSQYDADGSVAVYREDEYLATVCGTIDGSPIANANLIAAAPELLEALEWLIDFQNGCPLPSYEKNWNRAIQLSRAAIAKAEGKAP